MPSRPGDALTSRISGPRFDRIRSTPQTPRPSRRAARIAVSCSAAVAVTARALPPRCRLDRKSPLGASGVDVAARIVEYVAGRQQRRMARIRPTRLRLARDRPGWAPSLASQ